MGWPVVPPRLVRRWFTPGHLGQRRVPHRLDCAELGGLVWRRRSAARAPDKTAQLCAIESMRHSSLAEVPRGEPSSNQPLSLIHISEPTRQAEISYAVF